ncbi:hypothetical protein [Bacillus sp. Marseille-P3800]|uniref:hypothetical protein n=1 Tax=Bacillus sp. Marseille-P3800 TaxID=2014782 RepID=UPI000C076149|nr:hypothetical protein [Bacillus sp. Marseille-P3800]
MYQFIAFHEEEREIVFIKNSEKITLSTSTNNQSYYDITFNDNGLTEEIQGLKSDFIILKTPQLSLEVQILPEIFIVEREQHDIRKEFLLATNPEEEIRNLKVELERYRLETEQLRAAIDFLLF